MLNTYCIGATFQSSPYAERVFKTPTAPKNYVQQSKKDEYIQKVLDRRGEEHPRYAMAGSLSAVIVMDTHRKVLFDGASAKPLALAFLQFMGEQFPAQFGNETQFSDQPAEALFFGFNIKQILKVAAFEVLSLNRRLDMSHRTVVPVRFWHNPLGVYDPEAILCRSPEAKDIDIDGVLRFFEISETYVDLMTNARLQAEACVTLVERAQLAHESMRFRADQEAPVAHSQDD